MNFKTNIVFFVATFMLTFSVCTENRSTNVSQDVKEAVVTTNDSKSKSILGKETFVVSLDTPKDTYKSRLKALANKDETALYKTYSAGYLDLYQKLDKGGQREVFRNWSGETDNLPEFTSEKIEGNRAALEFKPKLENGHYGYAIIYFIKENNDWKIATVPEYRAAATDNT